MAMITCAGETFDTEEVEIFCKYGPASVKFQLPFLWILEFAAAFVILWQSSIGWRIALGFAISAASTAFLYFKKDLEKGEYVAIDGDKIYVRSVGGHENVVSKSKIVKFAWTGKAYMYELVLDNDRRIEIPRSGPQFEKVYDWMKKNLPSPGNSK